MARILRGEICWADLDPTKGREQAGQRPVLILSQDIFNDRSGTVIAVALTIVTYCIFDWAMGVPLLRGIFE